MLPVPPVLPVLPVLVLPVVLMLLPARPAGCCRPGGRPLTAPRLHFDPPSARRRAAADHPQDCP
jgi:hypothetical protein